MMEFIQDLTTKSSMVGEKYFFPMDKGAKDAFHEWYMGQERSVFTKRLDTYGHRIMPLLAVNELKTRIDLDIVLKTVALLDYQLEARKFADPVDADNKMAGLEETIRRLLAKGPMSKRDLEKYGNKGRCGIWFWDTALKNLGVETKRQGRGWVCVLPPDGN